MARSKKTTTITKKRPAKKVPSPSAEQIRAFSFARQRLGGSLQGVSPGEALAATGWVRSVGGASPYLALRARLGASRTQVDTALGRRQIHELPAARGCTYVVPSTDFAVALRAGQGHGDAAEIAQAKKYCGVTDAEIDRLCERVLAALGGGELDPNGIKEAVGDAVRSLGEAGKKKGMSTTLPLALGLLQGRGEIRRVPADGRLDRQRFRYALWRPSPLEGVLLDDATLAVELARRYFRWAAPATLAQFAWWAGLGVKTSAAAIEGLGLVGLADGDERLVFPDDRDAIHGQKVPKTPEFAFVGNLDNLLHPRREIASLVDEKKLKIPGEKKAGNTLTDLPFHAIFDRGRLIGLWDWDGIAGELVWKTFSKAPKGLTNEALALADWVRAELGDVRSMSLDSPESRTDRIALIRRMK